MCSSDLIATFSGENATAKAVNAFVAEVHNRRYGTDFPPNPVWEGPDTPPNADTGVVDVPEVQVPIEDIPNPFDFGRKTEKTPEQKTPPPAAPEEPKEAINVPSEEEKNIRPEEANRILIARLDIANLEKQAQIGRAHV